MINTDSINLITGLYTDIPVHIIGCGAVGSYFFQTLFRAGYPLNLITLWDFDYVEEANISSQTFVQADVGNLKTESLVDLVHKTLLSNDELLIYLQGGVRTFTQLPTIKGKYTNENLTGIVIIAVDSLESRIKILEKCRSSYEVVHIYTIGFPNILNLSDLIISFNSIQGENKSEINSLIEIYKQKLETEKEDRTEIMKQLALKKACRMPNIGALSQCATAHLFFTFIENLELIAFNLPTKQFNKFINPFL